MQATGEFSVNLQPLDPFTAGSLGTTLSRLSIEKRFSGDLQAQSLGEMLSAMTTSEGSAGYVAIEQVSGSLDGRAGSFVLQHYGIMHGGQNRLILEVVPGSGTGELAGLLGTMRILIENGRHHYEFDYTLP